ncbi:MAG: hypothetical protein KDD42_07360, partial [Bdellovibrionales bacterium]|nr:hypothetical protein [Bdellovibrionales bacterium]
MNEHEKVVKRFTGRGWCSLKEIWLLVAGMAVVVSPLAVRADAPPDETYRETIRIPAREERATVTEGVDSSWRRGGWQSRLSLGVTEAFFDEEDAETLPAIHYDVWKEGSMVNFRVGFEGSNHLPLHQENAQSAAEFPGKVPQVTYMR